MSVSVLDLPSEKSSVWPSMLVPVPVCSMMGLRAVRGVLYGRFSVILFAVWSIAA